MRHPSSRCTILLAVALLSPGLAAAQKLDKDDKKWLDEDVLYIISPEEKSVFKSLKTDEEKE